MSGKNEILLVLKKRLALGEITEAEYDRLEAKILADKKVGDSAEFDARATFQGIGIGAILKDRYEIMAELGRGGMGVVYKAKDRELETEVAVKVLPDELVRDARAIRSLMEEAKISMRLSHPHIMRLHTFESDERRKFLVMEYIEGETLESRLTKSGRLPESEIISIASEISEGLAYAHKQKVIHRDIKPSNIMISSSGEAKIMDFGIARIMKDSMTALTGRLTTGTLIYMSPEQIEGRDVDGRSDIYSLGVLMYELVSGNPPFYQGDITHQHLKVEPKPLAGVSNRLNEIVLKCMVKDKALRFSSGSALMAALEGKAELDSEKAKREAAERDKRRAKARRRQEDSARAATSRPENRVSSPPQMAADRPVRENPVYEKSRVPEPEMVRISGGTFRMGSDSSESYEYEKPAHSVTVSDFWMGKYEVTQAEWVSIMGSNPSYFKGDRLPVEQVGWNDVQEYLRKLNFATGKNYRLPREAEWEYACRAGTTGDRYGELNSIAWYSENSDSKTHPVGGKSPNAFGLHDMLGNVWEWCADWWDSGYYTKSPSDSPKGPESGACRVERGGSWIDDARGVRASLRDGDDPAYRDLGLGFRLARD